MLTFRAHVVLAQQLISRDRDAHTKESRKAGKQESRRYSVLRATCTEAATRVVCWNVPTRSA